jgi:two-component system, LytTR family, response regulator
MTAVIIEDEVWGRNALVNLIHTHASYITIVGEAEDVTMGKNVIRDKEPQLVFLDIRLGNRSGFDIIRQLPLTDFNLIVTTAYEEYAIQAFKVNAIDYLLKPIAREDLLSTLERINQQSALKKQRVHDASARVLNYTQKIAVPSINGLIFISLDQLVRCEAAGTYTMLILKSELPVLTTRNLGEYERYLLPSLGFLRIHHSAIVNIKEIIRYIRGDGGQVIMTDGAALNVSRRKKNELMEWIEKI